jgi:drug/metabolite transporter (DMT)-like permease
VRFLIAGGGLYAWSRARGIPSPPLAEWKGAAVVGGLLLMGGNGGVVWAEQWVASGLVALLVAVVPLWMVLIQWLWGKGPRPGPVLVFGILWGLAGMVLLVGSKEILLGGRENLIGGLVVLVGSFSWALGSVVQRQVPLPASLRMATALQMITGGCFLSAAALLTGELGRFDPGEVSLKSVLAFLYLVVFGALVAYSAYTWLLRVTTPARVSTYAYVNPVVALLLGWGMAGEPITGRTLGAAFMILTAVMLISRRQAPRTGTPRVPG